MRVNELILGAYLGTVFNVSLFLTLYPHFGNGNFIFIVVIAVYVVSYFLSKLVIKLISKIKIKEYEKKKKISWWLTFSAFFVTILLIFLFWFTAYSPGIFSFDPASQYSQAMSERYNDWHPAVHTFLAFKIPMMIFGNNPAAVTLVQIVFGAFVLAYMFMTIWEFLNLKWAVILAVIILINPYTLDQMMSPTKDTAFAILGALVMTIALRVYLKKNSWHNDLIKVSILALLVSVMTVVRHNGILFTLPFVIALAIILKNLWRYIFIGVFIFGIVLIKGPLYMILNVEAPGGRVLTTTGTPMTVLCGVAKNDYDAFDDETKVFLEKISSRETWEKYAEPGNYNSFLYFHMENNGPIEDEGGLKIIGHALSATVRSPKHALYSFFRLTNFVYGLVGDLYRVEFFKINDNEYANYFGDGVGNENVRKFVDGYIEFFNKYLFGFSYIGIMLLLMMVSIFGRISFKNGGWKKILLLISSITYTFGTMMFLSAPEQRLFMVAFFVMPITVATAFIEYKKPEKENNLV